jgi:hypothetical protein
LIAAVLTLTMAACAAKSAFDFDEDAAIKRAKEIIDIVNTKDYEAIFNAFGDDVRKLTTVDGIKASFAPILDTLGAFVEYKSTEPSASCPDGTKIMTTIEKNTIM